MYSFHLTRTYLETIQTEDILWRHTFLSTFSIYFLCFCLFSGKNSYNVQEIEPSKMLLSGVTNYRYILHFIFPAYYYTLLNLVKTYYLE